MEWATRASVATATVGVASPPWLRRKGTENERRAVLRPATARHQKAVARCSPKSTSWGLGDAECLPGKPLPLELTQVLSGLDRALETKPVNEVERAGGPLVILVLQIGPENKLPEGMSVHTAR